MKVRGIFLSVLLLASCGADIGKSTAAGKGMTDAGRTVHLKDRGLLEPVDNALDRVSLSANYRLHGPEALPAARREIELPKSQALAILKYRKFVVNEGGEETGAVGVLKGGPHDGARFVYVFNRSGPGGRNSPPWR